jgi:hypothetical protein
MAEVQRHAQVAFADVPIFLRELDQADLWIGAIRQGAPQTVPLNHVIGIDNKNVVRLRVHKTPHIVQRAGFEPREVLNVEESEAWTQFTAELFHRTP